MLWVGVCALRNFLNQISYCLNQWSTFPSMCWFKPKSILLFQCVGKHDFFSFLVGEEARFVHMLTCFGAQEIINLCMFEDYQGWTNISGQTSSLICLLECMGYLGLPGDMSSTAQLDHGALFWLSIFEPFPSEDGQGETVKPYSSQAPYVFGTLVLSLEVPFPQSISTK